ITSRPTRGSRSTWCWPGCCSPRTVPARRARSWTECSRRRTPRTGRAASSRSRRCGHWRWLPQACPQGYVRVFADEGPPMAALLARLVAAQKADQAAARGVELGCLARVLRAFGGKDDAQGAGRDAAAAVPGLAEQLTARELEILVLLAAGMPNPRIAGELVVTVDTVKKHVSHLLGKLGAANRTEAVTRARQLGLIP